MSAHESEGQDLLLAQPFLTPLHPCLARWGPSQSLGTPTPKLAPRPLLHTHLGGSKAERSLRNCGGSPEVVEIGYHVWPCPDPLGALDMWDVGDPQGLMDPTMWGHLSTLPAGSASVHPPSALTAAQAQGHTVGLGALPESPPVLGFTVESVALQPHPSGMTHVC